MEENQRSDKESALLDLIKQNGVLEARSGFRLASGKMSNLYIDLRKISLDPIGINLIGSLALQKIRDLAPKTSHVGGLETGSIPISSAIVLLSQKSSSPLSGFWVRKQAKDHGLKNLIEGNLKAGADVVIVDDVVTTGGSSLQAARAVKDFGAQVVQVITIVDRGAKEIFRREGVPYSAFFEESDITK